MTSVFQMKPIVIIGHSLTDPNIKHIIYAAKKGAGVNNPICWIAPDVKFEERKKYLEKYRIRVISYNNKDGQHKNLYQLLSLINEFIPPRTVIKIQQQIAEISSSPLGKNAAAPGFFVFNKLSIVEDIEDKRIEVALAAILSILPKLDKLESFSIEDALIFAGWPPETPLSNNFSEKIIEKALEQGLLIKINDHFKIGGEAHKLALSNRNQFEHLKERFKKSLVLRLKRTYPQLQKTDFQEIASDIESSLTGYFRECGLSLATTLFSKINQDVACAVPSSIIKFITESCAKYDDLLKRQAFHHCTVDSFTKAEDAEREYLGRISQGFFAFHSLGAFGETAIQRLDHAKNTVWLIDSSALIPVLALAAPTFSVFRNCFSGLNSLNIRLFTTEKLLKETHIHLNFAQRVINKHGCDSPHILSAAEGNSPYNKSNEFMQGFIRWQAAGHPCDWESYIYKIFDKFDISIDDVKNKLSNIGIEVISYDDWPGFHDHDYNDRSDYIRKIIETRQKNMLVNLKKTQSQYDEEHKKALPEAEAFVIIKKENSGDFYMISERGSESPAWFISHTSVLNVIENTTKITWQPEAFIKFASTLFSTSNSSSDAFETILWGIAQSGLNIIDDKIIWKAFGGITDQANIDIKEQQKIYNKNLASKYGEPIDSVLKKIPHRHQLIASIQLQYELLETSDKMVLEQTARAKKAEKELKIVEKYKAKALKRQALSKKKAKKQKARNKSRKKK